MNGDLKPGYKTTEFWITAIGTAMTFFQSIQGSLDPKVGAIVMAVMQAAYAIARALAKKQ